MLCQQALRRTVTDTVVALAMDGVIPGCELDEGGHVPSLGTWVGRTLPSCA
jgi:hypothetical protein